MKKNLFLLPAALIPFIAAIFYFDLFDATPGAKIIYLAAKIFILAYPLFFISKTDSFKAAFHFNVTELLIGSAVGVLIFAAGFILLNFPVLFQIIAEATPFVKSKAQSMGVAEHYLVMAFVISFIHSMLEEYYWRWFLFGASKAMFLSAVAFSLHHFIVLDFYYSLPVALILTFLVFVGGLIFNLLYRRKKNVWGAWAAHVGADLLIFYTGYLLLYPQA